MGFLLLGSCVEPRRVGRQQGQLTDCMPLDTGLGIRSTIHIHISNASCFGGLGVHHILAGIPFLSCPEPAGAGTSFGSAPGSVISSEAAAKDDEPREADLSNASDRAAHLPAPRQSRLQAATGPLAARPNEEEQAVQRGDAGEQICPYTLRHAQVSSWNVCVHQQVTAFSAVQLSHNSFCC